MAVAHDAIKAHDFASHLKSSDLLASIGGAHAGFKKAGANGVQRMKTVAVSKQLLTSFDTFALLNNIFYSIQVADA
jgi:hypothetical protein